MQKQSFSIVLILTLWGMSFGPSGALAEDKGREAAPSQRAGSRVTEATVKAVIAGDAVLLANGETLRYIGINAPKTKYPKMDVYYVGKESYEFNKKLVGGKTIRLEYDVTDRDPTGRLLAYVYVGDTFVNAELVKNGMAYSAAYPPNTKHQEEFNALEREAREKKLGLWAEKKRMGKPRPTAALEMEGEVEEVIAGDTVRLSSGQIVRMIGITAPKFKNIPEQVKKGEYYGKEAYEFTHNILQGKKVRLLLDVQQHDVEGRMLAYIYVGDTFVNAELVKKGLATVTTYPPNVRYEDLFLTLEKEARENKLGLWAGK